MTFEVRQLKEESTSKITTRNAETDLSHKNENQSKAKTENIESKASDKNIILYLLNTYREKRYTVPRL